jgi:hypothetical protein
VFRKNLAREWFNLAKGYSFKTTGPIKAKAKAANAAE